MTKMYIENDPYNWFDRLNDMEKDIKTIAQTGKDLGEIVDRVEEYFLARSYRPSHSIKEDERYRLAFFNQEMEESLVFILEAEMNLYYLSLSIHNEEVRDLENYSTEDNPHEFFSMFLD